MIAEEDGEVDTDFPALDSKEAISKFGFSTLALVEKEIPKPVVEQPTKEGKLSCHCVSLNNSLFWVFVCVCGCVCVCGSVCVCVVL